ncbi:MAG: YezD family protein [Candidatus Omnitrophica bacterium]|nr:YezD family protein [Candidatus Omnitrophota bacterium]
MDQPPSPTVKLLDRILAAIGSMDYGVIEIVVHNKEVVQIEKKEKIRIFNKK